MRPSRFVASLSLAVLIGLGWPWQRPADSGASGNEPRIGSERSVADLVLSGARNNQQNPAAAWGGNEYLVAWEDRRTPKQDADIWAARVNVDGEVLDAQGFSLAILPRDQAGPSVAFDGTNFLVVWWDESTGDISGVRVSPDGRVLDPEGILISSGSGFQPAVAWSGSTYFVTWADSRGFPDPTDVFGARVDRDGTVIDPDGILLWPGEKTFGAGELSVGWNGVEYLVAWTDFTSYISDIRAGRMTADGVVLDEPALIIARGGNTFVDEPAVAVGGDLFLVSFSSQLEAYAVRASRVTSDGIVLDPGGLDVGTTNTGISSPSSGWDGQHFLVAWNDYTSETLDRVHAARVAVDGTVLDPEEIEITDHGEFGGGITTAVAGNGSEAFVTWGDDLYSQDSDVHGARVAQDGTVIDLNGVVVSTLTNQAQFPAVASDGKGYLAVWQDDRAGNHDVYATRVTSRGQALDGTGVPIAVTGDNEEHPVVTWDGTNYLVVWERYTQGKEDLYATRVTADGIVLDDPPILVVQANRSQLHASIASNGANSLVVWEDDRNGHADWRVYGARVAQDGTVLDERGFRISFELDRQGRPAVESDGTDYLVVWQAFRAATQLDVHGSRVTSDGIVLDDPAIPISEEPFEQGRPALAWDGGRFLVAWTDHRNDPAGDVYGARIDPDGVVIDTDGIPVSTAAGEQLAPTVAWDRRNHVVVWSDRRFGTFELVSARVGPDGAVLDPDGVPISDQPGGEMRAASAANSSGRVIVTYERFAQEQPYAGVDRSFLRLYGER